MNAPSYSQPERDPASDPPRPADAPPDASHATPPATPALHPDELSDPAALELRGQITNMLLAWGAPGEREPFEQLLPLVYDQLHQIAHRQLGRERTGHTLNTTALVHEAYLRLVDQTRARWVDRAHFFAVAARVMRRILVDYARRYRAAKRGGDAQHVGLDLAEVPLDERSETLITLDEALGRLAELNPRLSQVVECRFFGGMTEEETAEALGVTDRTVRRDWLKAKAWLSRELQVSGE
jgi:RNA polymerase sigma factor (TIGR02999 family)